jgi:adenylate cyclase
VWAAVSLLSVPPLDDNTPVERATGVLVVVPALAVVLYALAAGRYLAMLLHSGSPILLGVTSAWVLLAEACVAVALGATGTPAGGSGTC